MRWSCSAAQACAPGFAALLLLPGCDLHPPRATDLPGQTQLLLVNPAMSMVTNRQRPLPGVASSLPVLCAQPNPDWASAITRKAQLSGSGSGGGASGSLNGTLDNSEADTQLAGRTAGVVALRDGLYSACLSYGNGVIGQDAYALILSQYGDLLVALAAPASAAPPAATPGKSASVGSAEGGGAAASPLTASLAQQEAVKALLVTCLSENDPTGLHAATYNPLLRDETGPSAACRLIVGTVAERSRDLLRPAFAAVAAGPARHPQRTSPARRRQGSRH